MTQSADESDNETSTEEDRGGRTRASAQRPAKRPAKKSGSAPSGSRAPERGPVAVARSVGRQLQELSGKAPESVTAVESTEEGWLLHYEVVESHRVPDSADILALYEVRADKRGNLASYRRLRRYARGYTGDDPQGGQR